MDAFEDDMISAPEMSDQEWVERFAAGYRQSFDRGSLADADEALGRIFAKYNIAEAI